VSSALLSSIDSVHEGARHRVKDQEKAALFHAICTGRSLTRQLLSVRLGIRPSSVSEAIQELVDDDLVAERSLRAAKQSGRPRLVLTPKPDRLQAISLYVDSRELKAVLLNMDEEPIAEESRTIPARAGNPELFSAFRELLERLAERTQGGSTMVGAGLALVGTINPRSRVWVSAARWPRLDDLDLSTLSDQVGFPVMLRRTNDAELEYQLQSSSRPLGQCALLLHWGFGIGTAVSFRGETLTSSQGRFGEIGHVRLDPGNAQRCLCGSRGCLETTAALWALMPALKRRLTTLPMDESGLAPLLASPRILNLPEIRRAFVSVRDALLVLYQVFHPDTVLLSGPFTENPAIFDRVADGFRRSLPAYASGAVRIVPVPAGNPGCRRGGANPLFRQALGRILRRST
jgi:predicted NBD/HSP70 family sugar kinase